MGIVPYTPMYVNIVINIIMKTIVALLQEINLLSEAAPGSELGTGGKIPYVQDNTNMSTGDGRVTGFTPETFPVYRSASMEEPQDTPSGKIVPVALGFGINQASHEALAKIGKVYGVDIGPVPGSKEAAKLLKSNPDKQIKSLYLSNNEIKSRERTTDIYNRLASFGIDLSNNDIHKDYTNPDNHGEFDYTTPKLDYSQEDQKNNSNDKISVD
jgi:hypothetical protein